MEKKPSRNFCNEIISKPSFPAKMDLLEATTDLRTIWVTFFFDLKKPYLKNSENVIASESGSRRINENTIPARSEGLGRFHKEINVTPRKIKQWKQCGSVALQ